MAEARVERRLAAILAADIAGYSALMGADEARTVRDLKGHQAVVLPMVADFGGRIIDTAGDGILAEFSSIVNAVECAIAIQRAMGERNAAIEPARRMQFRIGVNLGDVIYDDNRIFGDGINVAARLEAIAQPGGISISEDAWRQVQGKVPANFVDTGEQTLKNIARPLRVYRFEQAPATAAVAAPQPRPEPSEKTSIAVLAFSNMSGDPEQEYFSDGISEDIITDLSKLPELRVIARNSSFTYKGKAVDVKQVGRELGASYVLEGSVRKAGNRVRVTGQLIDAASGAHVWADRFDRDLVDIFAVQDELTREIIAALKLKLTSESKGRLSRRATIDVEAYNLFLRGREQALLQRKSGNVEARALLERAVAISPEFAAAYAFIAFTRLNDYIIGAAENPEQSLQTSLELATRAVAIDDEDPYAHFVLSVVSIWRRDYETSRAEVERCLALSPSSAEGHLQLANVYYYDGDSARALETLDAYMQLDPLYPGLALHFVAQAQHALGQYEAAVATLKRRLERDPNSETGYALLASCYGHLGRYDEARAAWAEVMRIAPDFSVERRWSILPFKDQAGYAHRIEGLRKAGLAV